VDAVGNIAHDEEDFLLSKKVEVTDIRCKGKVLHILECSCIKNKWKVCRRIAEVRMTVLQNVYQSNQVFSATIVRDIDIECDVRRTASDHREATDQHKANVPFNELKDRGAKVGCFFLHV
jgi:hypothetical protein